MFCANECEHRQASYLVGIDKERSDQTGAVAVRTFPERLGRREDPRFEVRRVEAESTGDYVQLSSGTRKGAKECLYVERTGWVRRGAENRSPLTETRSAGHGGLGTGGWSGGEA